MMSLLFFLRDNARFLSAGVILTFCSSFGQTYFIAIFSGQIMSAYGLTDGQWGGLYTVSTTASAIVMFWAGALTDHHRVRALAVIVFPALALVCAIMAFSTSLWVLVTVVFLLRLFGQGMMSQLAMTAMARWFVARRGVALSISALGFAAGQAVLPPLLAGALGIVEWRMMWLVSSVFLLLTLPVVFWLLMSERTPQALAKETPVSGMEGRHWTRRDVIRSGIFWLMLPMLLGPPSWGTALFFQQVHIADIKGWPLVDYLSLIPLLTAVAVTVTLASGQLIDKFGSARLIQLYLIPWMIGFAVMWGVTSLAGAAVAFLIFGVSMGLQTTVITAFWAEFYGTRHIGAIKATSTSIMVFGSAIGPGISGALIDLGYDFPSQMLAISLYFLCAFALLQVAVTRARRALSPPEVNVESA